MPAGVGVKRECLVRLCRAFTFKDFEVAIMLLGITIENTPNRFKRTKHCLFKIFPTCLAGLRIPESGRWLIFDLIFFPGFFVSRQKSQWGLGAKPPLKMV
jgi:hypothetical protein